MHIRPDLPMGIGKMTSLLVVGNGFDLAHGLSTSYQNFRQWLINNNPRLYERIGEYFPGAISEDLVWWNQFESNLDRIDLHEEIVMTAFVNQPDYGLDDFKDRDNHRGQWEMEEKLYAFYMDIQDAFNQWIASIEISRDQRFLLGGYDIFLNFNYTDTLQRIYKIPEEQVLHIHGRSSKRDNLIIGHEGNPYHYEQGIEITLPNPPDNLTAEQYERWFEDQAATYDFTYSSVETGARIGVRSFIKPTEDIILKYRVFFGMCRQLKKISFYGLSMTSVDMPYVDAIAKNCNKDVKWTIYCYTQDDMINASRIASNLLSRYGITVAMQPTSQFPNPQLQIPGL